MKNILTLIVVCLVFTSKGQDHVNNFMLDDTNGVYWQRVYEADVNIDDLISHISSFGVVKDIQTTETTISGVLEGVVLDYKGYGQSEFVTAIYVARSNLDGGFYVEIRDGRYRATIKNMTLVQRYEDPLSKVGQRTPLATYVVGRNGFKKSFTKKPSEIIDFSLNKIFEYKQRSRSDDW